MRVWLVGVLLLLVTVMVAAEDNAGRDTERLLDIYKNSSSTIDVAHLMGERCVQQLESEYSPSSCDEFDHAIERLREQLYPLTQYSESEISNIYMELSPWQIMLIGETHEQLNELEVFLMEVEEIKIDTQ